MRTTGRSFRISCKQTFLWVSLPLCVPRYDEPSDSKSTPWCEPRVTLFPYLGYPCHQPSTDYPRLLQPGQVSVLLAEHRNLRLAASDPVLPLLSWVPIGCYVRCSGSSLPWSPRDHVTDEDSDSVRAPCPMLHHSQTQGSPTPLPTFHPQPQLARMLCTHQACAWCFKKKKNLA